MGILYSEINMWCEKCQRFELFYLKEDTEEIDRSEGNITATGIYVSSECGSEAEATEEWELSSDAFICRENEE